MPTGYNRLQIALHWVVILLIVFNMTFADAMSHAFRAMERGQDPQITTLVTAHIWVGLLMLALVALRLIVRLSRGAPALPEEEPPLLKLAAHATHWGLYALMIVVPLTGIAAWYGEVRIAGGAHEVLQNLLMLLAILHFAGAMYQQFVLKTNIMARMKRPG